MHRSRLPPLPLGLVLVAVALAFAAPAAAGESEADLVALELLRHYDAAVFARAYLATDDRTRLTAARAAGRLKDRRAVGPLLRLLSDEAGPVRRAAWFALGQIGGRDLALPLRGALAGAGAADMPHAVEALGKTKDPRLVATIVRYLDAGAETGPTPELRGEAALALFRIGDPSALTELFPALAAERAVEPRWRIAYAIFRLVGVRRRQAGRPLRLEAAWRAALAAATDPARPFAERVFATLAFGGVADGRRRLHDLVRDRDARVVVAAIRALRGDHDPATMELILSRARHDRPSVREAVVRYFLAAVPPRAERATAPRTAAVARALKELHLAARARNDDGLHLLAREGHAQLAENAVALVAGATPFHEELVWRVNSHHPSRLPSTPTTSLRGQVAAAEVCGEERIPKPRALRVLGDLLKVRDFTVRATAITSLVKRDARGFAFRIVAAAKDSPGTANADVRIEAAKALAAMATYDPWLDEAARDPDRPVREAARAALKKLGRTVPAEPPPAGFSLFGLDAAGILAESRTLVGARVTLKTDRGDIVMVLHPDSAPAHCVNFARLVERGFYDNKTWHRVVADFVIQGGCPRGDGWGGPGYYLPDEIGPRPYVRGTVGMPKAGDDTGGCQIFITHLPTPHLDGRYTVYAQVIEGLAVVDRIQVGDRIEKAILTRRIK